MRKTIFRKNSIKVILTEYFFESLVLLAHVLCVPYEVLYITSKNSRKYEVEPLSPSQQKNFETYFKQDLMLYDFFNQSLHRKVEEFGHDVSIYNKKNKNFIRCSSEDEKRAEEDQETVFGLC